MMPGSSHCGTWNRQHLCSAIPSPPQWVKGSGPGTPYACGWAPQKKDIWGLYNAQPVTFYLQQVIWVAKEKKPTSDQLKQKGSVLPHGAEKPRVGPASSMAGSRSLKLSVNWRKMHNLKVVSWILFGDHTGDYSLGHSLSAWRNFSKEVREEPGYMEIFGWKKKIMQSNIRILLTTKNRYLKLMF